MCDFQPSHELEEDLLHISSFLLSPPPPPVPANNIDLFATATGRKRKRPPTNNNNDGSNGSGVTTTNDEKNLKKITHRETEKQRRKDMAKLHASLRSLLPLEYIKGKRSISDHMHQAVNYINNLQKKISQLRLKNPNLSTSSSGGGSAESCTNRLRYRNNLGSNVTINLCGNGLEILIRLNNRKDDEEVFPISRMMRKMVSEGLNLSSYLFSKTHDDATLYSFTSEVDDPSCCIDKIRLQKMLMDMIMQEESTSQ